MNRIKVAIGLMILGLLGCDRAESTSKSGHSTQRDSQSELSAEEILSRVDETYATCRSYLDQGLVKTVFAKEGGGFVNEYPFTTAFVRPDRFRYEFTSKPSYVPMAKERRFIIWANGDNVKTWWDVDPGVKTNVPLTMAIAKATGVSGGSAHTVPVLVMPKRVGGAKKTALHDSERLEDAHENEVPCFRVKGYRSPTDSRPITLWISKETFLIHKIDESVLLPKTSEHPEFEATTTTTYAPKIDIDIKPDDLAFNAPKE